MIHKRTGKRIINKKTGKIQAHIRKAIAIALTITLLPIESVLGCIPEKVHAAEVTEVTQEVSSVSENQAPEQTNADVEQANTGEQASAGEQADAGDQMQDMTLSEQSQSIQNQSTQDVISTDGITLTAEVDECAVVQLEWSEYEPEEGQENDTLSSTYYEIFRDGEKIATVDDTYTYADETGIAGETYLYVIEARNEAGEMLVGSNAVEVTMPEALVVSSNVILTEDLKVYTLELTEGTLNLNGYTLQVCKDYKQTNGVLYFNNGALYCQGNFTVQEGYKKYAYIRMEHPRDYLYIGGDGAFYNGSYFVNSITDGLIEIKGNLNTDTSYNSFNPSGNNKIVFCGEEKQLVSMYEYGGFNIVELRNYSEDGVVFNHVPQCTKFIHNNCNVSYAGMTGEYGWTLQEDTVYQGNLVLMGDTLDLNGYQMTITGNLIQPAGTVIINGGKLVVEGDYKQCAIKKSGWRENYDTGCGQLIMTKDSDTVLIEGSYISRSTFGLHQDSSTLLTAGTLEVKKDFLVYTVYYYNNLGFKASENHKVLLSGEEPQEVRLWYGNSEGDCFANLELTNTSEEGILLASDVYVTGEIADNNVPVDGRFVISETTSFTNPDYSGDLILAGGTFSKDLTINGDLYINQSVELSEDIHVKGDCIHTGDYSTERGTLTLNKGKLTIDGNYQINGAKLSMTNEEDYIHVLGDVTHFYDKGNKLTAGTFEIGGDLTSTKGLLATGNHRFLFSGTEKQTITMAENDTMGILETTNSSEEGLHIAATFVKDTVITHGNRVVYGEQEGEIGWTLQEDTVYEGDLVLLDGTLDLNGYELTITGDLYQLSGNIKVNNGRLLVNGDYNWQYRETVDGEYTYSPSKGVLLMAQDNDYVCIDGSFTCDVANSTKTDLTAGVMEVKGDVFVKGDKYITSKNHWILLSGEKAQKLEFTKEYAQQLENLEIANSGEEGVTIVGMPYVLGSVKNSESIVHGALAADYTTTFVNDYYKGDICIPSHIVIDSLLVDGNVSIVKEYVNLEIKKHLQITGNLTQAPDSTIYMQEGQLTVIGNYTVQTGTEGWTGLKMTHAKDYVHVHGDVVFNVYDKVSDGDYYPEMLTAGTFEIGGDLTSIGGIRAKNTHKFIFSGTEKQTIDINDEGFFATVELKNSSEEGVWAPKAIKRDKLIRNNCKISYGSEGGTCGFRLTENMVWEGDLILFEDTLNLNGYELTVTGDLIQFAGGVQLNGGRLNVNGDYRLQSRQLVDGEYVYSSSYGTLYTNNGYVFVGGDFVSDSLKNSNWGMSGTIEVKGDVTLHNFFQANGKHKLLLNGDKKQTVYYGERPVGTTSYLYNVEITNTSTEGVVFENYPQINGKLVTNGNASSGSIAITGNTILEKDYFAGDVRIMSRTLMNDITIGGNMGLMYDTEISGKIVVEGDFNQMGKALLMESGILIVEGDYLVGENTSRNYPYLSMTHSDDYIHVYGTFTNNSEKNYILTNGILEVGGDFISTGKICATGDHKLLLSGTGLQTISVQDTESLAIVELQNYSEDGVYSEKPFIRKELIQNGCKFTIGDLQMTDWKLTSDYVYDGDFVMDEGILDLDGHTLTITGELMQRGGEIRFHGGTLIVEGDCRMDSTAQLVMKHAADKVLVYGDTKLSLNPYSREKFANGTLELKGDFSLKGEKDCGIGNTLLVFSGTEEQTWITEGEVFVTDISNQNVQDLNLTSDITVQGTASDKTATISGAGSICIHDLAQLAGNDSNDAETTEVFWSGSVILTESDTLDKNITIEDTFTIRKEIYAEASSINAGNMVLEAPFHVQSAQIHCVGDFTVSYNGKLLMQEREGYLLVGRNFTTNSTYTDNELLTAGTMEIRGDFRQPSYRYKNFRASGEHVVILNPINSTAESLYTPTIILQYNWDYKWFNKLILKKPTDHYYCNYPIDSIANEVVYEVTNDTPPTELTYLKALTVTEKSITLAFGGAEDDTRIAGYEIYRDGEKIGVTSTDTYTDYMLKPDTEYTYTVYPFDAAGNLALTSPSCVVTTKVDIDAPTAPTALEVYTRTGSSITVKWNPSSDNVGVTGYTIYRNGNPVASGVNGKQYRDTGLVPNTVYKYYVVAEDAAGNPSQASKTIEAVVAMPEITGIRPADYSSIGGDKVELIAQIKDVGNSTGNKVKIEVQNENGEWAALTPNLLKQQKSGGYGLHVSYNWDISKLPGQKEYKMRFTLYDSDGNTDVKEIAYHIDRQAPREPDGFTAQASDGTVILNWEASQSADCTYYNLYRQEAGSEEWQLLARVQGRYENRFVDKTIEAGKTYAYVVTAVDQFDNESTYSAKAEVLGTADLEPPQVTNVIPGAGRINGVKAITTTARDNKQMESILLKYRAEDSEQWTDLAQVKTTGDSAVYEWDTTGLKDGVYVLNAIAVDAGGNQSMEEFTLRYEVDNTGIAQIQVTNAVATSTAVQLHWADVTESDFGYFQVEQKKGAEYVRLGTVTDVLGYNVNKLTPGTEYCFRVVGYDNLGNRGIESEEIVIATGEDTIQPTITSVYPIASCYRDFIELEVRASDNDVIRNAVFSYSLDKENYTEIAGVLASQQGNDATIRKKFDISEFPDGSIYVKFEVYDASGNKNALLESGEDVVVEYRIDRTAPVKVNALSATGVDGYVGLTWQTGEEEDVKSYRIYRADAESGIFKILQENWNAYNYYDTTVKVGKSYIYKVAAVDIAGNEGESSDAIYATVVADEKAPEITGMSPADGECVGPESTVKVVALDNANLSKIRVEYLKADSSDGIWNLLAEIQTTEKSCMLTEIWDTTGLTEGAYLVRAMAWDYAGNVSNVYQVMYELDLTAPKTPELTADTGHFEIQLRVPENTEEDFAYYEYYRRNIGEETYQLIRKDIANTYTDTDVVPDTVYSYKVAAYDRSGNVSWSAEKTAHADGVDVIAPIAVVPENLVGLTGMELAFDGMGSSDNVRIAGFRWDMGNGDVLTGAQPVYTYKEAGIYTVTMEVWDEAGNTATAKTRVQILDKSGRGITKVRVVDEQGEALPYALVYVKGDKGQPLSLKTDGNGYVSIAAEAGAYSVAAYTTDYLPNDIDIIISEYETKEYELVLQKDELIVGELTVRRMTLAEMIEAGVDFSAPENYHRFAFTVQLTFAQTPIPVEIHYISGGATLQWYGAKGEPLGTGGAGGTSSKIGIQTVSTPQVEADVPVLAYISTAQTVSWLKEMYEVELGILNAADSRYVIEEATATLNLPERGVSLAKLKEGQSLTQGMGSIRGQERKSAKWILKGDDSGSYSLSADFEGVLMPFGAPVSAHFETESEFEVTTGEGLHIYIMPESEAYIGEEYYIQFKVVNESDRPFYNVSATFGPYIQPDTEYTVTDMATGEVYTETQDGFVIDDAGLVSQSVVLGDGQKLSFNCLFPGQAYYGTYHTSFEAEGDPEIHYYRLVDAVAETLAGANKGVKITVVPIGSHIYRSYVGYKEMEVPSLYGDPIDIASGYFAEEVTAFTITGATELTLDMHYNSGNTALESDLGHGWYHDYSMYLEQHNGIVWFYPTPDYPVSFVNEAALNRQIFVDSAREGSLAGEAKYSYGTYRSINASMADYELERNYDGSYTLTLPNGTEYGFDADGRLSKITAVDGKSVSLSYDGNCTTITEDVSGKRMYLHYNEAGQLVQVSDDNERETELTYDESNRLVALTSPIGETIRYTYDDKNHILTEANSEGVFVTNEYDEKGRVTRQEDAEGSVSHLSYEDAEDGSMKVTILDGVGAEKEVSVDGKGRITRFVNENGSTTEYTYDVDGNVLCEKDAYGNCIFKEYDEDGNLLSLTDKGNLTTTYSYDVNGNVAGITNTSGQTATYEYDDRGLVTRATDFAGLTTTYAYDGNGQLVKQTTAGLGSISYTYENGQCTSITDYLGNTTYNTYDNAGNLIKTVDGEGNGTAYTYDKANRLLRQTDSLGNATVYTYDCNNNVTSVTDALGNVTQYTYDKAGRQTGVTYADGTKEEYRYDAMGGLVGVTYADGTESTFVCDASGNVLQETMADGTTISYTYDLLNQCTSETDATGRTIRYEYYPNGCLYKAVYPDGTYELYTYNTAWKTVGVTDQSGHTTSYTYDAMSRMTGQRDALGNSYSCEYDAYGRLIKETDANGNSTTYAYDANGNCIRKTNALGTSVYMEYDALGRMTRAYTKDKAGEEYSISYTYDALGRVTSTTDEMGYTTYVTYDAVGNVVSTTDAEGNVTATSTYDAMGRAAKVTDALGVTTQYRYDVMGNLLQAVETLNGQNAQNGSTQRVTTYTYDNLGRLTSVTDPLDGTTKACYDRVGNVSSLTDANGGTTSYAYDEMGRMIEEISPLGSRHRYTYNAEGLLAELENARGQKTSYTYDAIGRVTSMTDELGTVSYTYDRNGNVLTVSDKQGTITRKYDALNRVTEYTDYQGNTIKYSYDELGNLIALTYPGGEIVRYTYYKNGLVHTVTGHNGEV
ncbi:MAG: PKD domain-containing protein, partial [Lachnospiraceae bacterium]|nr:PKD domain-containing protein [Lachnospiraceae bacterium]